MPFKFAHLLHDGDHEVAKALAALQVWWHTLVKAEALAHDDSLVASILKELIWPAMQWYRMLLIELDGVEFKHVPSRVKEQIYNWLHGLQTTTTTEYVFHDLRKLQNSSETGKLSRQRRSSKIFGSHPLCVRRPWTETVVATST